VIPTLRRGRSGVPAVSVSAAVFVLVSVLGFGFVAPGTVPGAAASPAPASDQGHPVDAARFEPGQCREFAPTSGDRHLTVFLDAGHGGLDPGAVGETEAGRTVEEAKLTLPVELDTMALLRDKGFAVVVSRTRDDTVIRRAPGDVDGGLFTAEGVHDDVGARDVCADLARADLLLGIYFDAGASQYDAGGVTGYDADRPFARANVRFATLVQEHVLSAMNARGWGIPDLGVVDDSELGGPALTEQAADYGHLMLLGPAEPGYFTTPSTMPGALTEPVFVTDPFEASLVSRPRGQSVIAGALAAAVEQYFAVSSGSEGSRPSAARPRSPRPPATSHT
jgi:N-acetylmuramoyl-L-alanine amidase